MIKFGASGTGFLFEAEGYKNSIDIPAWVKSKGLNCYEYSFGQGVRISNAKAIQYGQEYKNNGIELSVHAPYFINFATIEEEKAVNNHRYLFESFRALKCFGGNRCVFHPGSPVKRDRNEAFDTLLQRVETFVIEKNLSEFADMLLCAETMGKISQLGSIEEIIEICAIDKNIIPCIDFGHLNSRGQGSLKEVKDYMAVLETFIKGIGYEKVKNTHIHFSKIEYNKKGEIRHLTFEDEIYGPCYEPLAIALKELALEPYFICESAGTQTQDAVSVMQYYNSL